LFQALTADHPLKLSKIWQSASRSKAAPGQRDHSVTLRVSTLARPGCGPCFPCFFPHCTEISAQKRAQDHENGKFQPDKAISWRIANVMVLDCCAHMKMIKHASEILGTPKPQVDIVWIHTVCFDIQLSYACLLPA